MVFVSRQSSTFQRYPQLSPSLSSRTPHISARVHQDKQLPYHMTLRGFSFHHICSQCPTPVLSTSTYFNKFVVLVSYILCPCRQFPLSVYFPIFFPRTQTRYECVFLFLACLSSTVAGTPKHQCSLSLCFCLLAQRCSSASASPYNTNQDQTRQEMAEAAAARLTGQQGNEGSRLACLEHLAVFFSLFLGTLLISIYSYNYRTSTSTSNSSITNSL